MIKTCKCKHDGQDKIHGKGKRVFNKTESWNGTQYAYRCTVCSSLSTKTGVKS